jgi:hypothetical protein
MALLLPGEKSDASSSLPPLHLFVTLLASAVPGCLYTNTHTVLLPEKPLLYAEQLYEVI